MSFNTIMSVYIILSRSKYLFWQISNDTFSWMFHISFTFVMVGVLLPAESKRQLKSHLTFFGGGDCYFFLRFEELLLLSFPSFLCYVRSVHLTKCIFPPLSKETARMAAILVIEKNHYGT